MRIVQVIDSLNVGGAERMAVNMANILTEDGICNCLICTRSAGKLADDLNPIVPLFIAHKKHSFDFLAFIRFVKFIRSFKPNVIHAHSSSLFWTVCFKLFYYKCIVIWHDHNGMRPQSSIVSQLPYIIVSKGIYGVISVNIHLKEWAKNSLFVEKSRIRYLRNFPYLKLPELVHSSEFVYIVMIANLHEPKDHHTLIKAINVLVRNGRTGFKVRLLGKENSSSDYTTSLKVLISDFDVESLIQFSGEVPVEAILASAHIGVISSKSEGLPVSLLEYGLAALPVVVTNVGQCAEVVGHGKFGIVVPPQDYKTMAKAIEDYLMYPDKAFKMGVSFKHHITENYGPRKFLEEYYKLLNA